MKQVLAAVAGAIVGAFLVSTVGAVTAHQLGHDIDRAMNDLIRTDNVASQLGPAYQNVRNHLAASEYELQEAREALEAVQ
jgi:hypothetical protein